jgi:hypothetical protein
MAESVETRLRAIETFLPACERIGVLADAQYRQLNAKTLQIDDEFRGFIRPRHVAAPGRNFSMAACSRWRSARSTAPGRWNEWPEMTRRRLARESLQALEEPGALLPQGNRQVLFQS